MYLGSHPGRTAYATSCQSILEALNGHVDKKHS